MRILLLAFILAAAACSSSSSGSGTDSPADTAAVDTSTTGTEDDAGSDPADTGPEDTGAEDLDLEMAAEDFDCILGWEFIGSKETGGYYITNKLGKTDEAVSVAKSEDGGTFPVGTVIQLVPIEAMVKRKAGWSPATNDWEFFVLEKSQTDGNTIKARGTTDVVNQFGGNCLECHAKAESKWDFVCGTDHGCDPLPIGWDIIKVVQEGDGSCKR